MRRIILPLAALALAGSEQSGSSATATIGLYRTLVFERRVLVALDNAKDAGQVRPLLPGAGCMALITSRSPLAGLAALEGARSITLRVLSQPEARLMVSAITEP